MGRERRHPGRPGHRGPRPLAQHRAHLGERGERGRAAVVRARRGRARAGRRLRGEKPPRSRARLRGRRTARTGARHPLRRLHALGGCPPGASHRGSLERLAERHGEPRGKPRRPGVERSSHERTGAARPSALVSEATRGGAAWLRQRPRGMPVRSVCHHPSSCRSPPLGAPSLLRVRPSAPPANSRSRRDTPAHGRAAPISCARACSGAPHAPGAWLPGQESAGTSLSPATVRPRAAFSPARSDRSSAPRKRSVRFCPSDRRSRCVHRPEPDI